MKEETQSPITRTSSISRPSLAKRLSYTNILTKKLSFIQEKDQRKEQTEPSALIIDTGSGSIKAGLGKGAVETDGIIIQCLIGRPKHKRILELESDCRYIGEDLINSQGILKITSPMDKGLMRDGEGMGELWMHAYCKLNLDPGKHPVLLSESPFFQPEGPDPLDTSLYTNVIMHNRKLMGEYFFEYAGAPKISICSSSALSLYANGALEGLMVENGHSLTTAVPFLMGRSLPWATFRSELGGLDINNYLLSVLARSGHPLTTSSSQLNIMRIKEKYCGFRSMTPHHGRKGPKRVVLPDGTPILMGDERYLAPEILFFPKDYGISQLGVVDIIYSAYNLVENSERGLLSQVILSGGGALFDSFALRIREEHKKHLAHTKIKNTGIKFLLSPNKELNCWRGGALASQISAFHNMWVTKRVILQYIYMLGI